MAKRHAAFGSICNYQKLLIVLMLIGLSVIMLSACASQPKEPGVIMPLPKPEPLSAEHLQAIQPNSTVVLSKADKWLKNSDQLLNREIDN